MGPFITLMARYEADANVAELAGLVGELRSLHGDLPRFFASKAVDVVQLAARAGHLRELESLGLISELSLSTDSKIQRVAAFAYWKLGNHEHASRLQQASIATATSVESNASLESRVGSAILAYRSIGSSAARAAALESFEQVRIDSDEFRNLAGNFVVALDDHADLASVEAETVFRKVLAAPTDQDTCRLAAFVFWRRKDEISAAEWQQRSLVAPRLLWTLDQVHYPASRTNEHPGRFRR